MGAITSLNRRFLIAGAAVLTVGAGAFGLALVSPVLGPFAADARVIPPDSVDWKAVSAGTAEIYVRELPGPANSLGRFKFDLPHGDGIYLHDTPRKELFAQDDRNLSHGCVRLQDAQRLARWLLGKDPPAASVAEQNLLLPRPVPITISYLDSHSSTQLAALN